MRKRILIVGGHKERADFMSYLIGLSSTAYDKLEVKIFESAFEAVTNIEYERPSAIITWEENEDMSGEEFSNIVRQERIFAQTPFLILSKNPVLGYPHTIGINPDLSTIKIIETVFKRLGVDIIKKMPFYYETIHFKGKANDIAFGELITWIAEMEFDGHWHIKALDKEGYMLMKKGDIMYVEYAQYAGNKALLAIFDAINLDSNSKFEFIKDLEMPKHVPRHIKERTERLLMEVMVDFDHLNADRLGIDY